MENEKESLSPNMDLSRAFDDLRAHSREAADLILLLSFLHGQAIPEELLFGGASQLNRMMNSVLADPAVLAQAIDTACRQSLLVRDPGANLLRVSSGLQEIVRTKMDPITRRRWAECAIRMVAGVFPRPDKMANWGPCERLLPQAKLLAELTRDFDFAFREAANLFNDAGMYLGFRGRYPEAERLYLTALAILEKLSLQVDPDLAMILIQLAELYRLERRYAEAERLYKRALATQEKVFGPMHHDVGLTYNGYGLLFWAQGRYDEAEPLSKRAVNILETVLEPENKTVCAAYNNLGLIYDAQGRYDEAESFFRKVLAVRERTLGPAHPDVGQSYNNLAFCLYRARKQYAEAEALYLKALAVWESALGPNHPRMATLLTNYAQLLRVTNRDDEAIQLEARVVAIRDAGSRNHAATRT